MGGRMKTRGLFRTQPDLSEERLRRDGLDEVLEAQDNFTSDKRTPSEIIERITGDAKEFRKIKILADKHEDWEAALALSGRTIGNPKSGGLKRNTAYNRYSGMLKRSA